MNNVQKIIKHYQTSLVVKYVCKQEREQKALNAFLYLRYRIFLTTEHTYARDS